jgi:hypothetical protein
MIYCVVPKPLADELYPKLVQHYRGDENVTVIVDRREFDRRARYAKTRASSPSGDASSSICDDDAEMDAADEAQRRIIRDRRRARVAGDLLPLARAS